MKKYLITVMIFSLALLILSACSTSASDDNISPQVEAGMKIFQANCSSCHLTEGRQVLVGPSLEGLASRAGSTISGMNAEDYIRQSILDPSAHVGEGFTNLMPNIYSTVLSEEKLDAVVAYLLTLK
ncbi:MAG: cytochrome c [Anaerolineales bacterium]